MFTKTRHSLALVYTIRLYLKQLGLDVEVQILILSLHQSHPSKNWYHITQIFILFECSFHNLSLLPLGKGWEAD